MGKMSYKDLEIYKKSRTLAIDIHAMTMTKLPKFEMFEEGSQIRRSSKSIVANITEGFGRRRYKQEFIKFLPYALASCDETRVHLDLLYETKSLEDKDCYVLLCDEYESLGRMLTAFIHSVEKGHKTSSR